MRSENLTASTSDWLAVPDPEKARQFRSSGYTELGPVVSAAAWGRLRGELGAAFAAAARYRDLTVTATGDSPRRLESVGQRALREHAAVVEELYRAPELLALLTEVAGEQVLPIDYEPEQYVASRLSEPGHVHGWHWDDYAFGLVWILTAPDPGAGGELEYVPGTRWDKRNPDVDAYLERGPIRRHSPAAGTAYLLRTDTCLHRVAPLNRASERVILCFAYGCRADLDRDMTHETVEQLY